MSSRSFRVWVFTVCVGLVGACTNDPAPADEQTTVVPSPATTTIPDSPPVTAPDLDIPQVGPEAWDRAGIPDDAIAVEIGDNPQAIIDENPPGTALLFRTGVHPNVQITRLKDGTELYGEPGAILDGSRTSDFAIVAYGEPMVSDVIIRGLTIENYTPPIQLAPVGGDAGDGWIIEFNEVRESAAAGLQLGDGSVARANHVHHNRQIGMKTGSPTRGVLIAGNVVSHNNYRDEFEYEFEAGGMKIVNSQNVTIEGNHVHSNHGPGIWTDGNNLDATITRNTVTDNHGPGIFHEISYDATVTYNIVERNAFEFYRGGILIASSRDVEVSGNALTDNDGGIVAIQEDRGGGDFGEFLIDRLSVHDNLVIFSEGSTGVLDNRGDGEVFDRDVVFSRNTYQIADVDKPFSWLGEELDRSRWLDFHPTDR